MGLLSNIVQDNKFTPEDVPNGATRLEGEESFPIIGAVSASNDWTAGWAYGLKDTSNGGRLWFNPATGGVPPSRGRG